MMLVEEDIFIQLKIGKGSLDFVLGIVEALAEPVVAKPRGGLDEGPPFVREILHRPIRQRHEHGSVGIQGRR